MHGKTGTIDYFLKAIIFFLFFIRKNRVCFKCHANIVLLGNKFAKERQLFHS